METTRAWFLLVLLSLVANGGETIQLDSAVNIIKLGYEVIEGLLKTWMLIEENNDVITPSVLHKWERKVLTQIKEVSSRLTRVETLVQSSTMATVNELLRVLPERVRLELLLHELAGCVSRVESAQQQLARYLLQGYNNDTDTWHIERHTLEDFATSAVSHSRGSIRTQLQRMHVIIASQAKVGPLSEGLMQKLSDSVQYTLQTSLDIQPNESAEDLITRLFGAIALVTEEQLQRVQEAVLKQAWACVDMEESTFEHVLH